MKTLSFRLFFKLISIALSAVLIVGCYQVSPNGTPTISTPIGPIINLPQAETPVLETILDVDDNLIIPYNAMGAFETQQWVKRVELRLRAIWPTDIQIKVEGQALPEVKDTASHPELDSSGYYRLSDPIPVHASDPRFFWKVLVVLPLDKRGYVDFTMTVHDISRNPNLSGTDKEAPPLQINIRRTPVNFAKPSSVFFDGSADQKQSKGGLNNAFIADNVTLAGWLVSLPARGLTNPDTEDWHYDIYLDNEFIERNYRPTTVPLPNAIMPGQWFNFADDLIHPRQPIPLSDGGQPNVGTFTLPGNEVLSVELNAWHRSNHTEGNPLGFVPQGWWVNDAVSCNFSDCTENKRGDVYWPFPVMEPWNYTGAGSTESQLQEGDYVIITGALIEDSAHLHVEGDEALDASYLMHKCWNDTYPGHGGWLEIHPLDSIRRIPKNQEPTVRVTPRLLQVCRRDFIGTGAWKDVYLTTEPANPPSANWVLKYREMIDNRFTDMSTIDQHIVEISPYDPTKLHVIVSIRDSIGSFEGHFSAVYLLWWEETNEPRPSPVPYPMGVATPQVQELPECSKKSYLPQCDDWDPLNNTPVSPLTPTLNLSPTPSPILPSPTLSSEPTETRDPVCINKPYLPQCR
jgi:hypothetical protein